jgi:hypothetical protein
MSALPIPRPQGRQKDSRKQALRKIVRPLEEQMEELGLSEVEKNARTAAFVEDAEKLKSCPAATPSK